MRQLKHHEKKLLRKVDLFSWKNEDNLRVAKILRRYHIQNRTDYVSYNRICGMITKLAAKLKTLPATDTFRIAMTEQLLTKLYDMGIINNTGTSVSLLKAEQITVSQLCRRRLAVVMVRLKMAETVATAVTWIEQGQVRVGPTVVTDPALTVPRNMEDYVTWVDQSKIRRTVQRYNDKLDDFDLL
jgi:U3 small nucleolar ribonucleoprotein protein IMP3